MHSSEPRFLKVIVFLKIEVWGETRGSGRKWTIKKLLFFNGLSAVIHVDFYSLWPQTNNGNEEKKNFPTYSASFFFISMVCWKVLSCYRMWIRSHRAHFWMNWMLTGNKFGSCLQVALSCFQNLYKFEFIRISPCVEDQKGIWNCHRVCFE